MHNQCYLSESNQYVPYLEVLVHKRCSLLVRIKYSMQSVQLMQRWEYTKGVSKGGVLKEENRWVK